MAEKAKGFFKTVKLIITEFLNDNCLNVAAAIVYFIIQSIVPLVLGVIVIASFFLQEGQTRDDFIKGVKDALPSSGIDLGKIINDLTASAPGLLSVSGLLLLWSGSSIFGALIYGINVAYGVKKDTRNFFHLAGLRFGLLFLLGALIGASFAVTILSQLIFSAKVELFGISPASFNFLLPLIAYLLPIGLMFGVFVILYKLGPNRKGIKWKGVLIGALVAALLFELLKNGFAFYLTAFNASDSYAKTYGALGGILLFLFYLWLSGAVMLLGAEVSAVVGGWKSLPVADGPTKPGAALPAEERSGATEKEEQAAFATSARFSRAPQSPMALSFGLLALGVALLVSMASRRKGPL